MENRRKKADFVELLVRSNKKSIKNNHSKHRNRPTVERNKTSQTAETESHEVFPKQSK